MSRLIAAFLISFTLSGCASLQEMSHDLYIQMLKAHHGLAPHDPCIPCGESWGFSSPDIGGPNNYQDSNQY